MNSSMFTLALVFLAVSIPVVLLLQALEVGGEYRLMIAMGAGALASAITQTRLAQRKDKKE